MQDGFPIWHLLPQSANEVGVPSRSSHRVKFQLQTELFIHWSCANSKESKAMAAVELTFIDESYQRYDNNHHIDLHMNLQDIFHNQKM
jgi:hypothetical protein